MTHTNRWLPADTDQGERQLLEDWLDFHREALAVKCVGLSADRLRERAAPPSQLSLLGLVRHLADVERTWFQGVLLGRGQSTAEERERAFRPGPDDAPETALAAWQSAVSESRSAAAGTSLDARARRARDGEIFSLRWIYLHMIGEYARHNGHADLLRERLDGETGL